MSAVCLLVAGALRASVVTHEFTVGWTHSVEKTRWEEHYRVDGMKLALIEARIEGSGAGMDPPDDAQLRNGWLTWQPRGAPMRELRLTLSPFAPDYDICWHRQCRKLHSLVSDGPPDSRSGNDADDPIAVVEIRACTPVAARRVPAAAKHR